MMLMKPFIYLCGKSLKVCLKKLIPFIVSILSYLSWHQGGWDPTLPDGIHSLFYSIMIQIHHQASIKSTAQVGLNCKIYRKSAGLHEFLLYLRLVLFKGSSSYKEMPQLSWFIGARKSLATYILYVLPTNILLLIS